MNNRVQELAEISATETSKLISYPNYPSEWCVLHSKNLSMLIIKECIMIVEEFYSLQEVADGEYVEYEASSVIKQHFGIDDSIKTEEGAI